jgi:serine/threonine protein kinase
MATNNFRPLRAMMNVYGRNIATSDLAKTSSARNYGKYFTRVVLPTAGANPARNFSTNLGVRRMSETRQNSIPLIAQPITSSSFRVLPADHLATNGIARYKVLRQIGSGNFAVVKEAVDRKTGNRVAIKIMNKKQCGKAICQNEVHVLTQLNKRVKHQRVTPVLDVFEDQENLYIVLELLKGGELFERVIERGRLPEPEVADILRKLVYALEALHRHGILHRDIKLENIVMRDNEDDFKLTDFGFAVDKGPNQQLLPFNRNLKDSLAGTLGYCAPEVLTERNYSPASDIWSAGVVFYILLSGRPPFPVATSLPDNASNEAKIAAEIEAIQFGRSPTEWRRSMMEEPWNAISLEAKRLVSKMLELDPKRRITTVGILQDPFVKRYTAADVIEYSDFE